MVDERRSAATLGGMDVLSIADLIASAGFDQPRAAQAARRVLEDAGLTRPGKTGIAAEKRARAMDALAILMPVCSSAACRADATRRASGRTLVEVSAANCAVCGGSNNRRSVERVSERLAARRMRRVAIIGGTPNQHVELTRLFGADRVELRMVDATAGRHSSRDAETIRAWADLVVVWAPTPLPHKVSNHYTFPGSGAVIVNRRGIEALCEEILRRLS